MFGRNGRAIMQEGEKRIFFQKVFNRNVRCPTIVISKRKHKLCFRLHAGALRDFPGGYTGPYIVESRPSGDAMKVSIDLDRRQLQEFIERKLQIVLDQSFDFKRPRRQVNVRRTLRIEHRPLFRTRLSRRNPKFSPRVGTDDHIRIANLFRFARLVRLVFWIFD